MRYILTNLLVLTLLNAGVIHPQLAEKLTHLESDESLQVIAHMKNQADLASLPEGTPKAEKILHLQRFATVDQVDIRRHLDRLDTEVSDFEAYWIFNGVTFKAKQPVIEAIAAREDVEYVIDDFEVVLFNEVNVPVDNLRTAEWNITKVRAPECWNSDRDGTGVIVGNIDSGVDVTHPALAGKWIEGGWYDAVNSQSYPYDDRGWGYPIISKDDWFYWFGSRQTVANRSLVA